MAGKSKHRKAASQHRVTVDPRLNTMSVGRPRRPWSPRRWTGCMGTGARTAGLTWRASPPERCPAPPDSRQIVYYVASVVVLYSPEAQTQRHYRGHTEDVGSLAVHPQVSPGPASAPGPPVCHRPGRRSRPPGVRACPGGRGWVVIIQVWNYDTLELVHILGLGELTTRVAALAFSIHAAEVPLIHHPQSCLPGRLQACCGGRCRAAKHFHLDQV